MEIDFNLQPREEHRWKVYMEQTEAGGNSTLNKYHHIGYTGNFINN